MGGTCAGVPEVLSWDQTLNEEREDVCELPALHDCSTKALVQKCLAAGGDNDSKTCEAKKVVIPGDISRGYKASDILS